MSDAFIPCIIKQLPQEKLLDAAKIAIQENPVNSPPVDKLAALATLMLATSEEPLHPDHIAVMTSKYWGAKGVKLGVSFIDNPPQDLRSRILIHMNAWSRTANVQFLESAQGEVRIARTPGLGHWSYLGTDILSIPSNQQTMNLDSFTMDMLDQEFFRVVRHEAGHCLAFPHEHMRSALVAELDVAKTLQYFLLTQGWSAQETMAQVLTPISERSLMGTPVDRMSIMTYHLPGSITKSGQPIQGGLDIDDQDYAFCAKIYPKADVPVKPAPPAISDWIATFKFILDALRKLLESVSSSDRAEAERLLNVLQNHAEEVPHA